ncbi:hypothetical protein KSS87_018296 [Heliosperma pusillum]|nr:hypothetical protein KSS87_018296 [Heliosperma pusillum]
MSDTILFKGKAGNNNNKNNNNEGKWKLWRSSSGDLSSWKGIKGSHKTAACQGSDSPCRNNLFSDAVATVVRAHPKDFKVVRKEWAAIRIQTAFRGFLARRAFKALKGIVRLQAVARVRARRVRMSIEGQDVQQMIDQRRTKAELLKEAEEGWCDSKRTLDGEKTKLQLRKVGAFKRERALAYSLAQKHFKSTPLSDFTTNISTSSSNKCSNIDKSSWSWLERWMAAKPWENRLMEEAQSTISEMKTPSQKPLKNSLKDPCLKSSDLHCSVKVRKNHMTTRISAKPPSSSPSSDFRFDESSASSSICTSSTPLPGTEENGSNNVNNCVRPSYMNLTESTKAKRRTQSVQRQSMEELQLAQSGACDPMAIQYSRPLNLPASRLDKTSIRMMCKENYLFN